MQIEELEALLGKKNVTAYLLGMSVIEITRAMRKFKIDIGELSCSSSYGLNKQDEYWL